MSLDEVWPLAYSEKGKAVRVLKSEYIENEEYLLLAKNGKQKKGIRGGHNEQIYRLSVACMEGLVAWKVKVVITLNVAVYLD